jgi:hypothetical protein
MNIEVEKFLVTSRSVETTDAPLATKARGASFPTATVSLREKSRSVD